MRLRTSILPRAAFAAALLLIAGCESSTGPDPDPGPVEFEVEVVDGDAQVQTVGQALPQPVTVRVTDEDGDPVAGQRVLFAVLSGGGSVTPGEVMTNSDGRAQTSWMLGTAAAAEQRAEARVLSDNGAVLASAAFSATATAGAPATITRIGADTVAGPAGATLADSLGVTVKDAWGNPVPGTAVLWSVVRGGGSVSPATTTTNAAGVARTAWTLGAALDSTQAVLAAAGVSLTTQFIARPAFPVGAGMDKVSGGNQTAPAGTPLPQPLVVRVRTALGVPLAGVVVTWSSTGGALSTATSVTDAQGLAQARWTLGTSTAGAHTADARVLGGSGATLASVTFSATATAGAPASITRLSADSVSGPAGAPLADSLAVLVRDAHGNPVPGTAVAWSVVRGGGSVSSATTTTSAAGIARTEWTLGFALDSTQVVRAAAGVSLATEFRARATFPVGSVIEKASGDNQNAFPGDSLAQPLVVRVRTSLGAPLPGVTVAWTRSAGTLSATTTTTDANGLAQVRWVTGGTAGAQTATATAQGLGSVTFAANVQPAVIPTVVVTSPVSGYWATADARLTASCAECATLRASVGNVTLATGTTSIDQVVSLAAYAPGLPQPGSVTIAFTGTSASGDTTLRTVGVTVYQTSPVEWLTRAGSVVLDVSAQRILYVRQPGDVLWIRHRTTGDSTRLGPVSGVVWREPTRFSAEIRPRTARLTPHGAIWADAVMDSPPLVAEPDTLSRVREFRNGVFLDLGRTGWSRHALAVELPWAAWSDQNQVFRRDLQAGTTALVATDALAPMVDDASSRDAPGDVDVAANGDVVYVDDTYNIVRVRNGVATKLTTDGNSSVQNRYPGTDGASVVFFRRSSSSSTGEIWRIAPDGTRELLLSGVGPGFDVNNGWIAFGSRTRSPSGTVHQWPGGVQPVGASGDVVFFQSGIRTLGRAADGTTAQLPRADGYVDSFWRGSTGYHVVNGNIFRIVP
ncbi:MAG TPA: Ig-like domain-containing protein [Longimicrobium sp.]|nr:Ig-like domain-containing protein [Longimicrobium sp.]